MSTAGRHLLSDAQPIGWPSAGVVPARGLLPGSVSHPWLTRRRSASMRCFPQPPTRNDHRPVTDVVSKQAPTEAAAPVAVSRALSTGERGKQNMDALRARHG